MTAMELININYSQEEGEEGEGEKEGEGETPRQRNNGDCRNGTCTIGCEIMAVNC